MCTSDSIPLLQKCRARESGPCEDSQGRRYEILAIAHDNNGQEAERVVYRVLDISNRCYFLSLDAFHSWINTQ